MILEAYLAGLAIAAVAEVFKIRPKEEPKEPTPPPKAPSPKPRKLWDIVPDREYNDD